jgi:acyl-coenzyme A thioesterase PaaI-like protein
VAPDGRVLTARSEITHRGRTLAIGTSEVADADGKRVAVATASAMILRGRPASLNRGIAPLKTPA